MINPAAKDVKSIALYEPILSIWNEDLGFPKLAINESQKILIQESKLYKSTRLVILYIMK